MNDIEEVLYEGIWCASCHFVEESDDLVDGRCRACGCVDEDHVPCNVVRT